MIRRMVFCVCVWISVALVAPVAGAQETLWVFPDATRLPLLNAIDRAHRTIDVVMYGFTDKRIMAALIKAQKRNVNVRLILQRRPYKSADENNEIVRYAHYHNIAIHYSSPQFVWTHQKTMVVDNKVAYIMTFNFTHSTYQKNRNFALVTTNPKAIAEITRVFNADWMNRAIDVSKGMLWWSPDNALARVKQFISNAHSSLLVYNQEVVNYQVVGALARLAQRGVNVQVLVPFDNAPSFGGKLAYLVRHGVKVRLDRKLYIHAKAMLADYQKKDQATFVGSMNFSDDGLMHNRELGMSTFSDSVAHKMNESFRHDWRASIDF